MRSSRLTRSVERRTRKTIILSTIGIVIILFLLLKFGLTFLVNFSLFIANPKGQQQSQSNDQINFIAPPILNPLPSATNSAQIVISGKAQKNQTIVLYINNNKQDQVQTDPNGGFTFSETLNQGDNQIKTMAEGTNNRKSDFSNSYDTVFKNSKPTLNVTSPSDGQSFNKNTIGTGNTIEVTGSTDPGVSVTVNGFWAVIDTNNNFSYSLPLQNGDNQIKIIATDQAGNTTEKDLKVNFSQ